MQTIKLVQPRHLAFGCSVSHACPDDIAELGVKKVFILCDPHVLEQIDYLRDKFTHAGIDVAICTKVVPEPTIEALEDVLVDARAFGPDGILGIGGGSTLDLAKLVAVLLDGQQNIYDCFGICKVHGRKIVLIAIPTTAGTGSEVTPLAIITDTTAKLKKGVVSPYLVPDSVYVDPDLTLELPPMITASTGMDALTHCIEVYTNRYSHPMVDIYALEGIRLIGTNLECAVRNGENRQARASMSLASLYGGLGLGPVNTAAVHALSYPIGGEFHVPHGVANALLLPYVLRFNQSALPERHARIADALGIYPANLAGYLQNLLARIELPQRLRDLKIPEEAIPHMAESVMQVTRLLKNNPRVMTEQDIMTIYHAAF